MQIFRIKRAVNCAKRKHGREAIIYFLKEQFSIFSNLKIETIFSKKIVNYLFYFQRTKKL